MYRVTTPTHSFTLPSDTSDYTEIQVSYKQGDTKLVKHYENGQLPEGMTLDGNVVKIRLSQTETKAFSKGQVYAQVRTLDANGDAYASVQFELYVNDVISEDILS